ncbi:MAG: hypothetical protein RR632_07945, partial [Christensenella sp.]
TATAAGTIAAKLEGFETLTPETQSAVLSIAQNGVLAGRAEADIMQDMRGYAEEQSGERGSAEWIKYRDEARQILPAVESAQKNLVNNLHKAVDVLGFDVIDPAPKSAESTADKIYRKRNNEGNTDYNITTLKDHTRASVTVNNLSDISQAVEAIKQVYPDLHGEVLQKQSGYVGYHLTIRGAGGINSEIQITTPEALRIKKIDDEFYQKWRNIDEKSMTDVQKKEHLKDKAFTQKLWNDYYAGFTPDVISKASSSVKGLESIQVPMTPWNAAQLPSKNSNISNTSEDGTIASNLPPSVKPYSMSAIDNTPPISDNVTPKGGVVKRGTEDEAGEQSGERGTAEWIKYRDEARQILPAVE